MLLKSTLSPKRPTRCSLPNSEGQWLECNIFDTLAKKDENK